MKRADVVQATDHCTYCPTLCVHACPVATAEANDAVSPWAKMSMARWLALGVARDGVESAAVLYKCTGCGACTAACRHGVPVGDTLRQAREDAVGRSVTVHPRRMFEPPVEAERDDVLPVGASGVRLYAAGFTREFREVARERAARWATRRELVFASAEDVRCVRDVYPLFDVRIRPPVLLAAERPRSADPLPGPVAYHESCHLVRSPTAQPARVREAAQRLAGEPLIELRWHGEQATCCGAAAGYAQTSPDGARAAARRVLENAILRGARTLVTGCGGCAEHLAAAAAGLPLDVRGVR